MSPLAVALLLALTPRAGAAAERVLLLSPSSPTALPDRAMADALALRLAAGRRAILRERDLQQLLVGDLAADVDAAVERAKDAYRRLAFAQALAELQQVEDRRHERLACPGGTASVARLLVWKGAVEAAMGNAEATRDRFRSALFANPDAAIDRVLFPPAATALFDEARAGLSTLPEGELSLSADFAGAELVLDGARTAASPATFTAATGVHCLCARAAGAGLWGALVRVAAGHSATRIVMVAESREERAARLATAGDALSPEQARPAADLVGARLVVVVKDRRTLLVSLPGEPGATRLVSLASGSARDVAGDLAQQIERLPGLLPRVR